MVAVTLTLQPVAFQIAAYAAALLNHYLTVGILEGRTAYAGQDPQEIAGLKTVYTALLNKNASGTATAVAETIAVATTVMMETIVTTTAMMATIVTMITMMMKTE